MRRAHSRNEKDSRVRMDLAVVLGLEGRLPEAESLVKADLPPDDANARVAELKQLLSKKEAASDKSDDRAPDRARARAIN